MTTLANVPVALGQQALAPIPAIVSATLPPPSTNVVTPSTIVNLATPSPSAVQTITLTQEEAQKTVTIVQQQPQAVIPTFIPNFPVVQTTAVSTPPPPAEVVPPAPPPVIVTVTPAVPPAPLPPSQPTVIEFMDGPLAVTQTLGLPIPVTAPSIPAQPPVAQPDPAAVQALESLLQGYPVFLSRVAAAPIVAPTAMSTPEVMMTISLETPLVLPSTTIDVLTIPNNAAENTDPGNSDGSSADASTLSAFRVTVTYDPLASDSLGPLGGSGTSSQVLGFVRWELLIIVVISLYS